MTAPLLTHALPGIRAWMVDGSGRLLPYTGAGGAWEPGVTTARCARGERHAAPDDFCTCGIHAFHSMHHQLSGEPVVGAIAAWGDMLVFRDGFRAQHATVLALARGSDPGIRKAAARYGVPVIPRRALQPLAGLLTGALPASMVTLPENAVPDWLARRRGYAAEHQTWAEPCGGVVTLGVSEELCRWLGEEVDIEASPRDDRHVALTLTGAGGAIALPMLVRGNVLAVNPAPAPTVKDPEGGCWIARIAPSDWEADCGGFAWGVGGRAAMLAETRGCGPLAWEHLRADREPQAISSWRDVRAMLDALKEQKPPPRFASAADFYDEVGIPLGQALARDRSPTRLEVVLALNLEDPAARLVLDLRRGELHTGRAGPPPDLEASLAAEDFLALADGRFDLARESRTGRLRVRGSLAHALSCLAIVGAWAHPHVGSSRPS